MCNQKIMSDKSEEERELVQLEAKLDALKQEKKATFEKTREADENLTKIREEERHASIRLHQIRSKRVEKDQRRRHLGSLSTEKKTTQREQELERKLEAVVIENDRLNQQLGALRKSASEKRRECPADVEELKLLRRQNSQQNEYCLLYTSDAADE